MSVRKSIFDNAGFESSGFLNLTPREAFTLLKKQKAILVDVREKNLAGYRQFDCPTVLYIPLSEISQRMSEIPNNKPVIMADSAGLRSHEAMEVIIKNGYKNVANLAGGLVEWERDQLPVTINTKQRLSGSCMCQLRHRENK